MAVAGCSTAPTTSAEAPFAAGTMPMQVEVTALPGSVPLQVWYPAPPEVRERRVFYTSAYWGHARPRAAVQAGPRFPLVLLAHGWKGTRFDQAWVAEALARRGFIVAAIESVGASQGSYSFAEAPKLWFRAYLLRRVIDVVAKEPRFAGAVDTASVGVVGYSAGGAAGLVLAGAEIDQAQFAQGFPASAPMPQGPWSDARLRAVVALSPGSGPVFDVQNLSQFHVPTLILSGTGDTIAPEKYNAQHLAELIPHAEWHSIPEVDHATFMPICSPYGRVRRFAICRDISANVDRAQVHAQALARIEPFLRRTLAHAPTPDQIL